MKKSDYNSWHILLKNKIGKTGLTRESVRDIFSTNSYSIAHYNKIILDFDGIENISRSFADEIFKFYNCNDNIVSESGPDIVISNASDSIVSMMKTVSNIDQFRTSNRPDLKFFMFTHKKLLDKYLAEKE